MSRGLGKLQRQVLDHLKRRGCPCWASEIEANATEDQYPTKASAAMRRAIRGLGKRGLVECGLYQTDKHGCWGTTSPCLVAWLPENGHKHKGDEHLVYRNGYGCHIPGGLAKRLIERAVSRPCWGKRHNIGPHRKPRRYAGGWLERGDVTSHILRVFDRTRREETRAKLEMDSPGGADEINALHAKVEADIEPYVATRKPRRRWVNPGDIMAIGRAMRQLCDEGTVKVLSDHRGICAIRAKRVA